MANLSNLKEGDLIALPAGSRWFSGPIISHDILKVERVTPTQVIAERGYKFRKADGKSIGSSYYSHAEPATEELLAQHEAEKAARKLWVEARDTAEKLFELARKDSLSVNDQQKIVELFGHLRRAKK